MIFRVRRGRVGTRGITSPGTRSTPGCAAREPSRRGNERESRPWSSRPRRGGRSGSALREPDLSRFELPDHFAQRVDQLRLLDPGFRKRKGELVRAALRLVDEREALRPAGGGRLLLL